MQNYEILEHTGDVKIKAYGKSKEELFQNAMEGMFKILNPKSPASIRRRGEAGKGPASPQFQRGEQNPKRRTVRIESSDSDALLVDFLSEINCLRQVHSEIYNEVKFMKFSDTVLQAKLQGREVEEFGEDIKAVPFHELDIRQNKGRIWETISIFYV